MSVIYNYNELWLLSLWYFYFIRPSSSIQFHRSSVFSICHSLTESQIAFYSHYKSVCLVSWNLIKLRLFVMHAPNLFIPIKSNSIESVSRTKHMQYACMNENQIIYVEQQPMKSYITALNQRRRLLIYMYMKVIDKPFMIFLIAKYIGSFLFLNLVSPCV